MVGVSDNEPEPTRFANVDLDVRGANDLGPLIVALGGKVILIHHQPGVFVSFEWSNCGSGPDDTIVGLLDLIEALEPPARQAWDNADQRAFNIGINAGAEPYSSIYAVKPQTLKRLAAVNGMLEVTVYAPQRP